MWLRTETLLVTTTYVVLCHRVFGEPVTPLSCAVTRDGINKANVTCFFPQENWKGMTMFTVLLYNTEIAPIICRQENVSEALNCVLNHGHGLERRSNDESNTQTIAVPLQDAQLGEYYCKVVLSDKNKTSIQTPNCKLNQSDRCETVRCEAAISDQASKSEDVKFSVTLTVLCLILLFAVIAAFLVLKKLKKLKKFFKRGNPPAGPSRDSSAGGSRSDRVQVPEQGEQLELLDINRRGNPENSSSDNRAKVINPSPAHGVTTMMPGTTSQCTETAMKAARDPSVSIRRRGVRRPFDKFTFRSHLITIINAKPTRVTGASIFYLLLLVTSLMPTTPLAQNMTWTQCEVDNSTPSVTCEFPVNIRQERYDFSLLVQEELQEDKGMAISCHWLDPDPNANIACAGVNGYKLLTSGKDISNRAIFRIRMPQGRSSSYSCYLSTWQNTIIAHNCTGEFTQCAASVQSSDTNITTLKFTVGFLGAVILAMLVVGVVCCVRWKRRKRNTKWLSSHTEGMTRTPSFRAVDDPNAPAIQMHPLTDASDDIFFTAVHKRGKSLPPSYGYCLDATSSPAASDFLVTSAQYRTKNGAVDDPNAPAINVHSLTDVSDDSDASDCGDIDFTAFNKRYGQTVATAETEVSVYEL